MALDTLPGQIIVDTRDKHVARYLRSIQLRDPAASVSEGSQPWIDGNAIGDQLAVQSVNARTIGRSIPLSECTGDQLDQRLEEDGLPPRFPETGASGFVTVETSALGTDIVSGDELIDKASGLVVYQAIRTAHYNDGQDVPVAAISTGPTTNQDPGAVLIWVSPRPGCFPNATVSEQTDGGGLTGGRLSESDDEVRQRISDALANPAAAGNDANYQREVQNSRGHGVPVQKCFSYPATLGPGTTGIAFTLKPAIPGANRIPNSTQSAQVRDFVTGQFPADDGYAELTILDQGCDIVLEVSWATGAISWADTVTWPPRYDISGTPGAVGVTAAASATVFTLACLNGNYTGVVQPQVGQTIALYNRTTGTFSRKRIASFTGTGPWVITADTIAGASDTSYMPQLNQRACPWSDSLDLVAPIVISYFETLGPGEMRATFFDPGLRERRNPPAPRFWPFSITNRLAGALLTPNAAQGAIADAVVREGLGTTAFVGVPGAIVYLLSLGWITAFPPS